MTSLSLLYVCGRGGVTFQIARASRQYKCERKCKQVSAGSVLRRFLCVYVTVELYAPVRWV